MVTHLSVTSSHAEVIYGLLVMLLFIYFSFFWVPQVPVTKKDPPRVKGPLSCGEISLTRGGGSQGGVCSLPGWLMPRLVVLPHPAAPLAPSLWMAGGLYSGMGDRVKLEPSWECCPEQLFGKRHRKQELYLKKDLILGAEK